MISVCALAQPYLIKIAIDDHFAKGDFEGLTDVALMYRAWLVLMLSVGTHLVYLAGMRMLVRLREWLYERVFFAVVLL